MLDYSTRLSIHPGEISRMELPYSEVCCAMGVAGREYDVELIERDGRYAAQLIGVTGHRVSFPITYGEAGIFRDAAGFYYYPPMSAVLESRQ